MPTPAHPAPPTRLPEDSLGYALLTSAELIAEVVGGTALTDALARLWAAHPATPAGVRGAILDLTYSTLRDYGRQDFILGKLLQKPLPEPVQSLLRVALHRLAVRPDTAHTVVDQAVSAASNLIGGKFKGVANGVLRNALRQSGELAQAADTDMVAEHRHPPWWIRRLKNQYPQKWRAILAAGNTHPPMALRVNPLRASDDEVLADFAAAGITVKRLAAGTLLLDQPLSVSRLPGFAEGCLSVQDAGAQHAARYLDLDDGQRVLDACAAPGGRNHSPQIAHRSMSTGSSGPRSSWWMTSRWRIRGPGPDFLRLIRTSSRPRRTIGTSRDRRRRRGGSYPARPPPAAGTISRTPSIRFACPRSRSRPHGPGRHGSRTGCSWSGS